jgi:hypothetical protein
LRYEIPVLGSVVAVWADVVMRPLFESVTLFAWAAVDTGSLTFDIVQQRLHSLLFDLKFYYYKETRLINISTYLLQASQLLRE